MFDKIFGEYLLKKGKLTKEELDNIYADMMHEFVKLGMIAVREGFMTAEQADEVNALQASTDCRFGDLAVEKGYITSAELNSILRIQGNYFYHFLQATINTGKYTLEQLDEELQEYQKEEGLSNSEMDSLISGDVTRVVDVYLPHQDQMYGRLCSIAVKTFLRLIDSNVYIRRAFKCSHMEADRFACQRTYGMNNTVSGFAGDGDALLDMASTFAKEEFEQVDLDALDSVAEFTNCVNGLFTTETYSMGVELEMLPPELYDKRVDINAAEFYVVPMISKGKTIYFIIAMDSALLVNEAKGGV